jgi:LAO/AO transport system kinase
LRGRIGSLRDGAALPGLATRVAAGETDPYRAADELLAALGQ